MWSKVFIVFINAFFPVLINTIAIRATDADLLRAARAFCASDWQIFKTVAIPGPSFYPHRACGSRFALGWNRRGGRRNVWRKPGQRLYGQLRGQTFRRDTVFLAW